MTRGRLPFVLMLAAAAAAAGCGILTANPAPGDTPGEAFARLTRALRSRDWAAVYAAAASPGTQKRFDEDFQKVKAALVKSGGASMFAESVLGVSTEEYLGMNARDYFVRMSEASGERDHLLVMIPDAKSVDDARIVDERIDGDEAWLLVKLDQGTRPVGLFRENGRWYFQLLDLD